MNKRNFSTRRVYDKRPLRPSAPRRSKQGLGSLKKHLNMLLVWVLVVVNVGLIVFLVRRIFVSGNPLQSEVNIVAEDAMTVEVLNGCGIKKVANIFAEILQKKGYDVVNIENAESFDYEESVVLDRGKRDRRQVEKMCGLLGVAKDRILRIDSPTTQCDVTFIIGADYKQLKSYRNLR